MVGQSRILVIDDEIGICEGIKRALEPTGLVVDYALDGSAGLDLLRNEGYDLVLLDIKMPQISGLDLIKIIQEIDRDIICIIITGYATVEMAITAIKQGAYDFLTKPFTVEVLLLAVNQGLERRSLSLEAHRMAQLEQETKFLAEEKDRLEKLDQAKRKFLSLVTHELKSPVAAVENYLKLILQGYVDPENQPQILQQCITRTREESQLIDDLLALGKLEVIEAPQVSPVHLEQVLEEVLEESEVELTQKNILLSLEIEPGIPQIEAVPGQARIIWRNLISNALKYTPEKGEISIGIRLQDSNLIGWVQDTGIGIPEEDQKNIFTEFFRAANAKAASIPGTGLGLVLVKRIVESLGGTITVASCLGEGSTFQFSLPRTGVQPG